MDVIIIIHGSWKILLFCYVGWIDSTTTTVDHATHYYTVMLDGWTVLLLPTVDHATHYYTVMLDGWTTALKEPILHCVNFYFLFSTNGRTRIVQDTIILLCWMDGQYYYYCGSCNTLLHCYVGWMDNCIEGTYFRLC